ncbi:MAG: lysylphosphatidylglycerol synthase transmembrane domain-containing protein [Patescibacteria group bacterium]
MPKGNILKTLGVLASIALGVGLLYYIVAQQGIDTVISEVQRFGFWPFVGFVVISLLNFTLYSWRWTIILRRQLPEGEKMPSLWRMYWHRMTGYAVGYLTPLNQAGGEPARVALLLADGVPSKSAVASATLDIAFELCSYVVFIALGVIFALIGHQGGVGTLAIMGGGLTLAFATLVSFFFALSRGKSMAKPLFHFLRLDRVKRFRGVELWLEETEDLMGKFFSGGTSTVVGISCLSMVMVAFRVVETFYIAWGFGVSLNFAQAFLISSLPGLALILPVPAGLGIFEGGFAAVFAALAVPLDPVAFALIIRLRDGVFMALGIGHMIRTGTVWMLRKGVKTK